MSKWLVKNWFRSRKLDHGLQGSCHKMMSRKDEFHAFIKSKRADLERLGVESIGLFGSTVRGEDLPESDLDVLVNFRPGRKTLDSFLELSGLLEKQFGCEVDLMTPEFLSRHFGPRILAETEYVAIAS